MGESIPKGIVMERRGAPLKVSKERYVSSDVHRRKVERLWPWVVATILRS